MNYLSKRIKLIIVEFLSILLAIFFTITIFSDHKILNTVLLCYIFWIFTIFLIGFENILFFKGLASSKIFEFSNFKWPIFQSSLSLVIISILLFSLDFENFNEFQKLIVAVLLNISWSILFVALPISINYRKFETELKEKTYMRMLKRLEEYQIYNEFPNEENLTHQVIKTLFPYFGSSKDWSVISIIQYIIPLLGIIIPVIILIFYAAIY